MSNPQISKSAQLVCEHVAALWDDQVTLAGTLIEKRKNLSTMVAVLVGLGVFRFQIWRRSSEIIIVSPEGLLILKVTTALALLAFAGGLYFLYTQRPYVRRFSLWCFDWICVLIKYCYHLGRAKSQAEADNIKLVAPKERWSRGRAIHILLPDKELLDDWLALTPDDIYVERAKRWRQAYRSLKAQNKRVSSRLQSALFLFLIGIFLVFLSFGVYLWTMEGIWRP